MGFQINNNQVPIVPIKIGDETLTLYFNKLLFENGIFAGVAVSPVVPPFHAMIRSSYTSCHTRQELDHILATFKNSGPISASLHSRYGLGGFKGIHSR